MPGGPPASRKRATSSGLKTTGTPAFPPLSRGGQALARLVHERQVLGEVGTIERDLEEEPQRRAGGVDRRRTGAARGQMQPKAPHILRLSRARRAAEKRREVLDPLHVV